MSQWQPTASIITLKQRAQILAKIRQFFTERGVLEVETPLLSQASVTNPYIESMRVDCPHASTKNYYLQTSPEYAMKRLLAAGSGAIFQLCKAFRDEGSGHQHNPEFTMLEWYRPGFDHHLLMDEMDELLQLVLPVEPAQRLSYQQLFQQYLAINPQQLSAAELQQLVKQQGIEVVGDFYADKDTWLQLLMTHIIEPKLAQINRVFFIYDFPASQASLAKIRHDEGVAERFEVYYRGLELANGFHELADGGEQRQRFLADLDQRHEQGLRAVPIDEHLLAALAAGFPNCAGVAVGIDRLVMLATGNKHIAEVMSFPFITA